VKSEKREYRLVLYGWEVSFVEKTEKKNLSQRFERDFRSFFIVHQW